MSSRLCCTDDRPLSPALPCPKRVQGSAGVHLLPATDGQDSRFTSTKSELQDLRRIFANANTEDAGPPNLDGASSTCSSKTARLVSFLRRRFSRDKTKSKLGLRTLPDELRKLKQDIRQNLMSDQGPDSGGYDIDALMLGNIDEIDLAELGAFRHKGGKSRPGLQDVQWAATAPGRYAVLKALRPLLMCT